MKAIQRFIVKKVVYAIWLFSIAKRVIRRSIGEAEAMLSRPYAGLPTGIEMLDGSNSTREDIRRIVVWLRNPLRLFIGGIVRTRNSRRDWLIKRIKMLPMGSEISYIMHYWDHLGKKQSLLTRDPFRGLRPPIPKKTPGPCKSEVMAAFHGDKDVTPDIKKVSASFHEEEGEICPVALDAYLRHRRGLSLKINPIMVTDATLNEREYFLEIGCSSTYPSENDPLFGTVKLLKSETPQSQTLTQKCVCW